MRFFALSVFTSLVFGIFCSATPTPEFAKLTVRAGTETLESVLTDFANNVGNPITENLSQLQATNSDTVLPHLAVIEKSLMDAAHQCDALRGVSVQEMLKSSKTGEPMDGDEAIQLINNFLGSLAVPTNYALDYVPMSQLVSYAFKLLGVLQEFFQIVIPALFELFGVRGVFSILQFILTKFVSLRFF